MELEFTEEQIKEIRTLRHKAVRRRQILVLLLVAAVITVFFCALGLHFSVFYTLIPIFFLAIVIFLGIRTSRHAMAWEKTISETKKVKSVTAMKSEAADAPTFTIPVQSDDVSFSLAPSDSGIKSLNMDGFNHNFVQKEKEERDLEKADLI